MTPEERARSIAKQCPWIETDKGEDILTGQIAAAIREAVAAEREACAMLAEGDVEREDYPWCGDVRDIAAAIRARATP